MGGGGMKLILRIIYVPFEIPIIRVTLFWSNIPVHSTDFRVKHPGKKVSFLKHQKRKWTSRSSAKIFIHFVISNQGHIISYPGVISDELSPTQSWYHTIVTGDRVENETDYGQTSPKLFWKSYRKKLL